jgi:hypothetical protein
MTENRPDKITVPWTDGHGNKTPLEVNMVADARDVVGLAGYPWLIIAANPQLSNFTIWLYLANCGIDGVERPLGWIQRKRWMFRQSSDIAPKGAKSNRDGNYARAVRIMREHPNVSSRRFKERGIKRSREWVRKHRCDPAN